MLGSYCVKPLWSMRHLQKGLQRISTSWRAITKEEAPWTRSLFGGELSGACQVLLGSPNPLNPNGCVIKGGDHPDLNIPRLGA